MIELEEEFSGSGGRISVVGLGGAGCIMAEKIGDGAEGVDIMGIDTDAAGLKRLKLSSKVQIGSRLTRGFGSAENPETARKALLEEKDRVAGLLGKPDIVFLIAGLGKGAGSGVSGPLAEIASESGAVTFAMVTTPFFFEGKKRMENSESSLRELRGAADALAVISNETLFSLVNNPTLLTETYDQASGIIVEAVQNVCEIVMNPGVFRVDLPQIKRLLRKSGLACFGSGSGEGEGRLGKAIEEALKSPLVSRAEIPGSGTALIHIRGGKDLTQEEVQKASESISSEISGADRIIGVSFDRKAGKKVRVWLLLSGVKMKEEGKSGPPAGRKAPSGGYGHFLRSAGDEGDELDIPAIIRKQRRAGDGV